MSDLSATLNIPEYEPEASDVPTDNQHVDAGGNPETEAGPEPVAAPTLNLDEVGDHTVELNVAGETRTVSVKEAVSDLAQKGAYFTQEMQALRETERENAAAIQFYKAFERDPGRMTRLMATEQGLELGNTAQAEPEYQTPEEQKIAELETQLAQVSQRQSRSEQQRKLDDELAGLEAKYGELDRDALLAHAMDNNIIGNLDAAYAHMNADKIAVGREAEAAQANRQAVIEEKRATQVVSRSQSAASGSQQDVVATPSTFAESYLLASEGTVLTDDQLIPDFISRT